MGTILIVMSRESVKAQFAISVLRIIALTIFLIIAIAVTSLIITRKYITRPLLKLQGAATSISLAIFLSEAEMPARGVRISCSRLSAIFSRYSV